MTSTLLLVGRNRARRTNRHIDTCHVNHIHLDNFLPSFWILWGGIIPYSQTKVDAAKVQGRRRSTRLERSLSDQIEEAYST